MKCLDSVYNAICHCFLSAVDHLDYHPSTCAENDHKRSCKTSNSRLKRNAHNSHEAGQYLDLSADIEGSHAKN